MSTAAKGTNSTAKSTSASNDTENRARLSDLVHKMTTSGLLKLDEKLLKVLKQLCRLSDEYVKHVFYLLMTRLEMAHGEVRLSAFQIARELFSRSHCFRDLLLSDFQHFVELVLGINPKQPLPPPKAAATELKCQAAKAISQWQETFGKTYKKLSLAYNFLKSHKKVDFLNIQTHDLAEQQRQEETRLRRERRDCERLTNILQEMNDTSKDIDCCITEAENCISLLLSDHDIFNLDSTAVGSSNTASLKGNEESLPQFDLVFSSLPSDGSSLANVQQNDSNCDELVRTCGVKNTCIVKQQDVPTDAVMMSDKLCQRTTSETSDSRGNDGDEEAVSSMPQNDHELNLAECAVGHREHGIHSFRYALHIDIAGHITVQQTEDNSAIVRDLHDQAALLVNRFLPVVKLWLQALSKLQTSQEHVRKALDMRSAIEATIQRINKLNIVHVEPKQTLPASTVDVDSDDDDEDLVEVPSKEGFEPHIPGHLREEYGLLPVASSFQSSQSWKWKEHLSEVEDPATIVANVLKRRQLEQEAFNSHAGESADSMLSDPLPSTSGTESELKEHHRKLLDRAPVVPFGSDLHFWGEKFEAPLIVRNTSDSTRWWSTRDPEDAVDINAVHASKFRVMNYVGKFEPVKWKCRAPLANGLLCERMDRYKCPFHGKIVARDEKGCVVKTSKSETVGSSSTEPSSSEPETSSQNANWDDPELQADILLATGVDLRRNDKGKGKGQKKKDEGGLTNLMALKKNTARKRLESKIFNSTAVKRVGAALDTLDQKRVKEKFANSFTSTFNI